VGCLKLLAAQNLNCKSYLLFLAFGFGPIFILPRFQRIDLHLAQRFGGLALLMINQRCPQCLHTQTRADSIGVMLSDCTV
jgi:hypothetical protein